MPVATVHLCGARAAFIGPVLKSDRPIIRFLLRRTLLDLKDVDIANSLNQFVCQVLMAKKKTGTFGKMSLFRSVCAQFFSHNLIDHMSLPLSATNQHLIWLVCLSVTVIPTEADAQKAERPIPVRTQSMHVHYELSSVAAEDLLRIELWYRRGQSSHWQLYSYDEDRVSPILFVASQEGLHQFVVAAVDRWGRRSVSDGVRTASPQAQLSVFVDYQPPQLYLYSPNREMRVFSGEVMNLRWGGFDSHLEPRPVQVFYRSDGSEDWQPITPPQPPEGEYRWRIPANLAGPVQIQTRIVDQAGHQVVQESSWITLIRPSGTFDAFHLDLTTDEAVLETIDLPLESGSPAEPPESGAGPETFPVPLGNRLDGMNVSKAAVSEMHGSEAAVKREAERLFRSGIWYGQRREWEKAIRAFKKVIELTPGSIEGQINLANAYFAQGQYEQALQYYERVLQVDPERRNAMFNLAQAQVALKQYDKSFQTLDRLVALDRRDWQAWLMRGETARQLGDQQAALNSWQYVAHSGQPYYRAQAQRLLDRYTR